MQAVFLLNMSCVWRSFKRQIVYVWVLIRLVTLTFGLLTLKLVCIIARVIGNHPSNFGVYGTFLLDLWANPPCDLATLTFDLGSHGTCLWCRSSCSICVPQLKLAGLSIRKIWRTSTLSALVGLVTFSFNLFTSKLVHIIAQVVGNRPVNFEILVFLGFFFWTYGPTTPVRCTTWPCDLTFDHAGYGACR